jgi:insulin receptor
LNHRCITETECHNLNINSTAEAPFIPFQVVCREGCPQDFQVKYPISGNKMSATCTPCTGKDCWRKCKPIDVDSVEAARTLKGCQVIQGALKIQIKTKSGVSIAEVLRDSLSDIIEIEDYLKVSRSYPIVSLKFLKNLKTIQGKKLENNKNSIVIWDNENLEYLFDDLQQLKVHNGSIFIHHNPRLCFDKIEKLSKSTSRDIEQLENAKLSNGDKTSCNVTRLGAEVIEVSMNSAQLRWNALNDTEKNVLEYVIYYLPAPEQNIDLWSSRDTCGNDG